MRRVGPTRRLKLFCIFVAFGLDRNQQSGYYRTMKRTRRNAETAMENARTAYTQRHAETEDLLKRIAAKLKAHKAEASTKLHWGFVGDLVDVNKDLAYILAGLGDTSAVVAKGLDY